jgi:hypothetical protein
LGDDAGAVVLEFVEEAGAFLDALRFFVEALGDAVGFGISPHGRD